MIYFDNAATTQVYPDVLKTYTEVASKIWGNPSSLHSLGSQASRILRLPASRLRTYWGKNHLKSFLPLAEQKGITG